MSEFDELPDPRTPEERFQRSMEVSEYRLAHYDDNAIRLKLRMEDFACDVVGNSPASGVSCPLQVVADGQFGVSRHGDFQAVVHRYELSKAKLEKSTEEIRRLQAEHQIGGEALAARGIRGAVLSPFAQTFVLKERLLQRQESVAIRLDAGLSWHWRARHDNLAWEVLGQLDQLLKGRLRGYSEMGPCVVQKQPIWGMEECGREIWPRRTSENVSLDRRDSREEAPESTGRCQHWRIEHWAYYCPAHIFDSSKYGIHLTKRGIAKLAQAIRRLCPDQPLEIILIAAMYKLFAHEMCHAWIEDICSLIDFAEGESTSKEDSRYARTQRRYNGYIFMEEAICNTAAYGWLGKFLGEQSDGGDANLPTFDARIVLDAFCSWMRNQPAGYKDFLCINDIPSKSEVFVRNVCRLLAEVYGYVLPMTASGIRNPLAAAVATFFGGHLDPVRFQFRSCDAHRCIMLCRAEPPVHVEK